MINIVKEVAEKEGILHKVKPYVLNESPEENPELWEKFTPLNLIDAADPPILIFIGTNDHIVTMVQVNEIEKNAEKSRVICYNLKFYFAGHTNDFLFCSNYN